MYISYYNNLNYNKMSVLQIGEKFQLADITGTFSTLPANVYILKFDTRENKFYLNVKEDFVLPKKIYGDQSCVDRWIASYRKNSEKNLGIILSGTKGGGKTITAQKFCMDVGLPTILITEPFHGPEFVDFITSPKLGSCTLFIDEYEKIYRDHEKQSDLLSLMDGNFMTSHIFLMTVNSFHINEYLVNRLNRVKYRKHYENLEESVIEDVCADMLKYPQYKESIYNFFSKVGMCTFDLLVNIIKEINLFNEPANVCGAHLNLESSISNYEVTELYEGKEYKCEHVAISSISSTIVVDRMDIKYLPKIDNGEGEMVENGEAWEVELNEDNSVMSKVNFNLFIIETKDKKHIFKFKKAKFKNLLF